MSKNRINLNDNEVLKVDKGVYVNKGTIVNIEDLSNTPLTDNLIGKFRPQLCLKLILDTGKDNWSKSLTLFGNYLDDRATGKIIKWSQKNNGVLNFLINMLENDSLYQNIKTASDFVDEITNEYFMIKRTTLDKLINRTVQYITYPTKFEAGKLYRGDLQAVFNEHDDFELIKETCVGLLKYTKKYNPEAYDEYIKFKSSENTNFNFGENEVKVDVI